MSYKFRVWDKEENKFWYFTLQEMLERKMYYEGSWDRKILLGEKTQCTDLKDVKGVDIYVNDIVLHEGRNYVSADPNANFSEEELKEFYMYDEEQDVYYEDEHTYMKVIYDNHNAMYVLIDVYDGNNYDFHYDFESKDVKVVGNTYENDYMHI